MSVRGYIAYISVCLSVCLFDDFADVLLILIFGFRLLFRLFLFVIVILRLLAVFFSFIVVFIVVVVFLTIIVFAV